MARGGELAPGRAYRRYPGPSGSGGHSPDRREGPEDTPPTDGRGRANSLPTTTHKVGGDGSLARR